MSESLPPRRTLESLKKEAKHWLAALTSGATDAIDRYRRAMGTDPAEPTLRDVQLALAREHGFAGWTALKIALEPDPAASANSLQRYEAAASALLEAYQTGTPEALERHYSYTWHRRAWEGMRRYVQLDLGKRPEVPDGDVPITLDDARYLVAREHGFDDWSRLLKFVAAIPGGVPLTVKPMGVGARSGVDDRGEFFSRDWNALLSRLRVGAAVRLGANGQMTDGMLKQVAEVGGIEELDLGGSKAVTDEGVAHLAQMQSLRRVDLSGTGVTDRGLAALRSLGALTHLSLAGTRVTDDGMRHLEHCSRLEAINLMWTATGDGALRALAGKPALAHFQSGNGITDAGLPILHDFPVFKQWQGGEPSMALLSYSAEPNQLLLRGPFTDRGMAALRGLDGLFGLNLDASELRITAAALEPLTSLPNLGWLSVDARDDWMPAIARMPRLRFLGCQDTATGDNGFVALSRSPSLEMFWGRRSLNLQRRGFEALATMPSLRGLSTSLRNVDDAGLSALPSFPALRELMPIDVPDAGYRHIGRCQNLESLVLMYCRETTDAATEQITDLENLSYYFNSYTTITDRTPALLATMPSLERITFDACHNLTDDGVRQLRVLPRLKELRVAGARLTGAVTSGFPPAVKVHYNR